MDNDQQLFSAGIIYGAGFTLACYFALRVAHFIWENIERWLWKRSYTYVAPPPRISPFYQIHFGRCNLEARLDGEILMLEGRTSTFDDFELYLDKTELKQLHAALGELIEQAPFPIASDQEAQA